MPRVLNPISSCALAALLIGCSSPDIGPPPPEVSGDVVAQQIVRAVPPLKMQRFSTVLDFESNADAVFLVSRPPGRIVYDRAHTGNRAVQIEPRTPRFSVKLTSLLSGRPFPGEWTLIGGFLYCEKPITVKVAVESAGFAVQSRMVSIAPNTWTLAVCDIVTAAPEPSADGDAKPLPENARVTFTIPPNSPAVWFDDLLLIDNTQSLVASAKPAAPPQTPPASAPIEPPRDSDWTVVKKGLNFFGESPSHFNFKLVSDEASADGWTLEEANDLRARFVSNGQTKSLTVYADGRSYWDGTFKPLSAKVRNATYVEQHNSPAEIEVAQELGRVNRNTPGDANNDGYNEQRGAYELAATEARLELKLTPRTSAVVRPVLEVTGLPPGKVLVTIEGRLVEKQTRLDDGTLLVELPARIDRPTTINLRLQ